MLIYPKRRELLASGTAALIYNRMVAAEACGAASATIPIPPQATAAGLTMPTYFDDFTSGTTLAPNTTVTSGYNLYPATGIGCTTAYCTTDGTAVIGGSSTSVSGVKANGNGTPPANATIYPNATAAGIVNGNSGGGYQPSSAGGILTLNAPPVANGGIATVTSTADSTKYNSVPSSGTFGPQSFCLEYCVQYGPNYNCTGQWFGVWSNPQLRVIPPGQTVQGTEELDYLEYAGNNNGYTTANAYMTTGGHCWLVSGSNVNPYNGGGTYNVSTLGTALKADANFHLYCYILKNNGDGTGYVSLFYDNTQIYCYTYPANIPIGANGDTGWNWALLFQYYLILSSCYAQAGTNQASTFATSGNSATLYTPNMNFDYIRVLQ